MVVIAVVVARIGSGSSMLALLPFLVLVRLVAVATSLAPIVLSVFVLVLVRLVTVTAFLAPIVLSVFVLVAAATLSRADLPLLEEMVVIVAFEHLLETMHASVESARTVTVTVTITIIVTIVVVVFTVDRMRTRVHFPFAAAGELRLDEVGVLVVTFTWNALCVIDRDAFALSLLEDSSVAHVRCVATVEAGVVSTRALLDRVFAVRLRHKVLDRVPIVWSGLATPDRTCVLVAEDLIELALAQLHVAILVLFPGGFLGSEFLLVTIADVSLRSSSRLLSLCFGAFQSLTLGRFYAFSGSPIEKESGIAAQLLQEATLRAQGIAALAVSGRLRTITVSANLVCFHSDDHSVIFGSGLRLVALALSYRCTSSNLTVEDEARFAADVADELAVDAFHVAPRALVARLCSIAKMTNLLTIFSAFTSSVFTTKSVRSAFTFIVAAVVAVALIVRVLVKVTAPFILLALTMMLAVASSGPTIFIVAVTLAVVFFASFVIIVAIASPVFVTSLFLIAIQSFVVPFLASMFPSVRTPIFIVTLFVIAFPARETTLLFLFDSFMANALR